MQAIFTLALALNAFLGGCAGQADASSSPAPLSAPASSTKDAAPQAAQTHAEVRLSALGRMSAGGNAPASIIARRNMDGDFSYQHPRFSAGRQGQPPPRKINT